MLGLLAIGHVGKARNDLADPAEGVLYRNRIHEQPAHVPVGADHPHHGVAYRPTAGLRRDVGALVIGHRRAVLAYTPVLARRLRAFELLRRPPEDALRRGVREDHGTSRIAYHDTARHRVIDGGEIVLRTWCRHRGTPSSRHARQRDLSRRAFRARSATGIGSRPERLEPQVCQALLLFVAHVAIGAPELKASAEP